MISELRHASAHAFVDDLLHPRLSSDDHHHIAKVLRVRDGESVSVSDGCGGWRLCEWSHGELRSVGDVQREMKSHPLLTVAVTPVKGDKTDSVVEKLVEIGIDQIVILAPLERSAVRWPANKVSHVMDRYQRIVRAAAMQCRRVFLPEIAGPLQLSDVVGDSAALAEPGGHAEWGSVTTLVIGPEGGFSPDEVAQSPATIDLGPHVLRADTAAVVGAGLMVAHWRG